MAAIGAWIVVGPKTDAVTGAIAALDGAGATVTEVELSLRSDRGGCL